MLFRNARYGGLALNGQFASANPMAFGVDHDRNRISLLEVAAPEIVEDKGKQYLATLTPKLDGIQLARRRWKPARARPKPGK